MESELPGIMNRGSTFRMLRDSETHVTISLDLKSMMIEVVSSEGRQKTRLSPQDYVLFSKLFFDHPHVSPYESLMDEMRKHQIPVQDVSKLHRKVSELRITLSQVSKKLSDSIINLRGVGYSLPTEWEDPSMEGFEIPYFKSSEIISEIEKLSKLIQKAEELMRKSKFKKLDGYYLIRREEYSEELENLVIEFNRCELKLLKSTRRAPADFYYIRIQAAFAHLRTYVGLARMSQYAISKDQWLDWFLHESQEAFRALMDLMKQAEN